MSKMKSWIMDMEDTVDVAVASGCSCIEDVITYCNQHYLGHYDQSYVIKYYEDEVNRKQDELNRKEDEFNRRPDQHPALESTNTEMQAITIVVEGGCVIDVKNLPDDLYYEIDDRDLGSNEYDDIE